jgi:hypothetical protein
MIERGARVELDRQAMGLDALRPGMQVSLRLRPDRLAADHVIALSTNPPRSSREVNGYKVTSIDPAGGVISIEYTATQLALEGLRLARDLQVELVSLEGANPVRLSNRPGSAHDVKSGMRVALTLTVEADGRVAVCKVTVPHKVPPQLAK